MPELWRVFCAVEIPSDVRARVVEHIAQMRAASPTARATWARDEALHITLKFFGEIESNRIASLTKAVANAARLVPPFSMSLEGTGVFPTHGPPRVLWIGVVDPSGNLANLQSAFEDECASEGFPREERKFHPHLTIARQRAPQGARTAGVLLGEPQFSREDFSVNEIVVIRSELRPEGSKYTRLSRHSLHMS